MSAHAERGGQMESQRGPLAFHTPETSFLTNSSPSLIILPSLIPLTPFSSSSASSSPRLHPCCSLSLTFLFAPRTRGGRRHQQAKKKSSVLSGWFLLSMLPALLPEDTARLPTCGEKVRKGNKKKTKFVKTTLSRWRKRRRKKEATWGALSRVRRKYWLQVKSN